MFETITVDHAITNARRRITYPCMVILFGLMLLPLVLYFYQAPPVWAWPVCIGSAIIFSWAYWSIHITKWKTWAFDNVRNVHDLKKRAQEERLIFSDNHFFTKTEIWTKEDKQKWELLQQKFMVEDDLRLDDDMSLPAETIIYYSKVKNFIEMLVMLALVGAGIFLVVVKNSTVFGIILSAVGAFLAYREFREATNRKPQIILSNQGIETVRTKFYPWKDIEGEDVEVIGSGKHTHYYLVYRHPDGIENLMIDDYAIRYKKLRKLLRAYRSRQHKQP